MTNPTRSTSQSISVNILTSRAGGNLQTSGFHCRKVFEDIQDTDYSEPRRADLPPLNVKRLARWNSLITHGLGKVWDAWLNSKYYSNWPGMEPNQRISLPVHLRKHSKRWLLWTRRQIFHFDSKKMSLLRRLAHARKLSDKRYLK